MISTESGAGSPILRARRARYLGIYRDLTRWRRFLAEYSGSAGLRCCPVVRACSRWTPRHTGLFQRSRQERQGKCSKARRSPYIIRQMPDAITTLPLARTDSSTLYPCLTPDRVDSTLSEIPAHAPIKMPDPPDSVGRDVDEVVRPLERHADVEELEAVIVDVAESIAEPLSVKASAALCGRTAEWVAERGFDELDTVPAETLVARQAALAVLLRAMICHRRDP